MIVSCNSEVEKKGFVEELKFIDANHLTLKFENSEKKVITFKSISDDSINFRIKSESRAYPNRKLLNKKFKVHYDLANPRTHIANEDDSIYTIQKIQLLDVVENYNEYNPEDYILPPSCTDEKVLNLIRVKFYNTIAKEEEKWQASYDFNTLKEDKEKFTCECELNMDSNKRGYHIEYSVRKEKNGKIEIYGFQYE